MPYDNTTDKTVFTPGPGVRNVECSSDPLNLRPAFNAAVQMIDEQLKTATPDKPLVVVMGENHPTVSHTLLQYMLITHYAKIMKDEMSIAMEGPHDLWMNQAGGSMRPNLSRNHFYHPASGMATLAKMMSIGYSGYAPVMHNMLYKMLLAQGLPAIFNDVAAKIKITGAEVKGKIDTSDAYTNDIYKSVVKETRPGIFSDTKNILKRVGIKTRNRFMADMALKHAKGNGARLVFQKTGAAHVYGLSGHKYKDSIVAELENMGANVLPIITDISDPFYYQMPHRARKKLKENGLYISGLDDTCFFHDPIENQMLDDDEVAEHSYIEALCEASGIDVPASVNLNDKRAYVDAYADFVGVLIDDYKKNEPIFNVHHG